MRRRKRKWTLRQNLKILSKIIWSKIQITRKNGAPLENVCLLGITPAIWRIFFFKFFFQFFISFSGLIVFLSLKLLYGWKKSCFFQTFTLQFTQTGNWNEKLKKKLSKKIRQMSGVLPRKISTICKKVWPKDHSYL